MRHFLLRACNASHAFDVSLSRRIQSHKYFEGAAHGMIQVRSLSVASGATPAPDTCMRGGSATPDCSTIRCQRAPRTQTMSLVRAHLTCSGWLV